MQTGYKGPMILLKRQIIKKNQQFKIPVLIQVTWGRPAITIDSQLITDIA
jgi:hypothetical protein